MYVWYVGWVLCDTLLILPVAAILTDQIKQVNNYFEEYECVSSVLFLGVICLKKKKNQVFLSVSYG